MSFEIELENYRGSLKRLLAIVESTIEISVLTMSFRSKEEEEGVVGMFLLGVLAEMRGLCCLKEKDFKIPKFLSFDLFKQTLSLEE